MRRTVSALLAVLVLGSGVWAQPRADAPRAAPAVLTIPLNDALGRSRQAGRLLVVAPGASATQLRNNLAPWTDPGLAGWAGRHAVAVALDDRDTLRELEAAGAVAGGPEQPWLFKDALQARLIGTNPERNTSRLRPTPPGIREAGSPVTREAILAQRLYWRLELTRRGLAARDPDWANKQSREALPVPAKLADAPADGLKPFAELPLPSVADAQGTIRGDDALARFIQFRAALASGDAATATTLATWLWETGANRDPAVGVAVRTLLPGLVRELVRDSASPGPSAAAPSPVRARLAALAGRHAQHWPELPAEDLFAELTLARAVEPAGRWLIALDLIDSILADGAAATELAPADRANFELMLPRLTPGDPLVLPSSGSRPVQYLKRGIAALDAPRLKGVPETQWQRGVAFRRWLMIHECARVHAALLAAGRDDEAREVRPLLASIRPLPEPSADVILATTALLAGVPRPMHAEWLGSEAPRLKGLIEQAIKPKP
jgi:hypothetical protein